VKGLLVLAELINTFRATAVSSRSFDALEKGKLLKVSGVAHGVAGTWSRSRRPSTPDASRPRCPDRQ